MTQRWIKYLTDPTGYVSVKAATKRFKMTDDQIYGLLEYEHVELVQYQHQDYFLETIFHRLEDPKELGNPHQDMWSADVDDIEDTLFDAPPCSLESLKARIIKGALPVGKIFIHKFSRKRVRYNGQELENLGVAREN